MPLLRRSLLALALLLGSLSLAPGAGAADIHVMTSGAFTEAYRRLGPVFERETGHRLVSAYGASMGNAPDAIPQRLARGEPADLVILADSGLENLVRLGHVAPGSRVDLVNSLIGIAVRTGAPRPDISSVAALRQALLGAQSIAYSASASGVYVSTELYKRLGIEAEVAPKSRRILSERVGTIVARGEAELGFQQMSELIPIQGITILGPLPDEVQRATIFAAGIATRAQQPEAALALLRFFNTPAAQAVIRETGLDPIPQRN